MDSNSHLMEFKPLDTNTLHNETSKAIDFLAKYYNDVEKYPVRCQFEPGYLRELVPDSAPSLPEHVDKIIEDINTKVVPGLTHWQSPNFFAYFPASVSNAGLLGEILCSGLNVVGFSWISSPAATELEAIVMDWMAKLLNLPQEFLFSGGGGGVMHGSTSEAFVCTLAAARDRVLDKHGSEKITKLVVYASDQTHFSFQKAVKLVGIPPQNFRVIPTSSSQDFALSPLLLKTAIEGDIAQGLVPLYVCATVGTTPSNSVDPVHDLGFVARDYGVWLHVDAAYAGSACICPEYRHYLDGVDLVDSISMNLHKWLLTNLDCSCLWLKTPKTLVDSLSTKAELLKNKATDIGNVIDYKDWQIGIGRRFRALKLWIVISRYGSANLIAHIRSDIELAKYFESLIEQDTRFELVVPRKFALVCFRLTPTGVDASGNVMNQKLLEDINCSGEAFMTHAMLGGTFAIRCAIGGSLTEKNHIDKLWNLIQDKATKRVEAYLMH
ncbi:tyrosine decarboxylase 1-like [Silene latifolia]|uniref:tyrosine decarboxylase 1-like n=1 Tax=Silene latifolia TaxID=37657 RepID=UPI003D780DE7